MERDTRDNNHARATTCVAMSLNDWRLLQNRSTSIHLETRLSCTYYTTLHRQTIYIYIYIYVNLFSIYVHCARVAILHNHRDATVDEVKTIPWKIGFTVPRFKQRVPHVFARQNLALPQHSVICILYRTLFHSTYIPQIYRCIQFFNRKRFCKEVILNLQLPFVVKIEKL